MGKQRASRAGGKSKSQAMSEGQLLSIAMTTLRQRLSQSTLPTCIHGYQKERRLRDFFYDLSYFLHYSYTVHQTFDWLGVSGLETVYQTFDWLGVNGLYTVDQTFDWLYQFMWMDWIQFINHLTDSVWVDNTLSFDQSFDWLSVSGRYIWSIIWLTQCEWTGEICYKNKLINHFTDLVWVDWMHLINYLTVLMWMDWRTGLGCFAFWGIWHKYHHQFHQIHSSF